MKFIFKLWCCLIMENVSFSIPHLRKIIFKIYSQKNTRKSNKKRNNQTTQIEKQIEKIWYLGHTDSDFVDF